MSKEGSENNERKRANLTHLLNQLAEQDDIIKALIPRSAAWQGAPDSVMTVLRNLFQEAADALPEKRISFNDNNDLDGLRSQINSLRGKASQALTEIGGKPPQRPAPHSEQQPVENMAADKNQKVPDRRKVFVVVGRNVAANDALFQFLRSIDLDPMEWSEAVALTGSGSPYPGDVLEVGMSNCQAVIVFLTGDDMARLGRRFQKDSDEKHERELTPQCRPNVLFEAGMAFGRYPQRTIIVALAQTRPFSDTLGRHIVFLSKSPQGRHELANRLRTAGCAAKTDNRHNWLTDGDFEAANLAPDDPPIPDLGETKPTAAPRADASVTASLDVKKKPFEFDPKRTQIILEWPELLGIQIDAYQNEQAVGFVLYMMNNSDDYFAQYSIEIVEANAWSVRFQKFLPNLEVKRNMITKDGNLRPLARQEKGQWLLRVQPDSDQIIIGTGQQKLAWPNNDPTNIEIWRITLGVAYYPGQRMAIAPGQNLNGVSTKFILVRWDRTERSLQIAE